MARRSPQNERYGKYTMPAGKTRKSAAAAKPKRAAGAAPTPAKSSKSSAGAKRERMVINPPTPEYRMWRNIWWGLLGAALVLTGGSWLVRTYTAQASVSAVMLALGYGSIFAALYVDWTKLRRLRQEWMATGRQAAEKEAAAQAKADKAAARADAATHKTEDADHASTDKS